MFKKWWFWVLVAAVLVVGIVYGTHKQRQTETIEKINEAVNKNKDLFTANDAREALKVIVSKYGKDMAAQIERVARKETGHFKSKQYTLTGTGGMEAHGSAPYYGWYSPFFIANPSYTPVGTTAMLENKGMSAVGGNAQSTKPKQFVIMPSVEAWMMFLADYATRHKDNGGILRWYSTDAAKQQLYANSLNGISATFTNSIA